MVRIRQQNEIVLALLDYYRTTQPNLDTKPGTVSRDLLVDGFAVQLSTLYQELNKVSQLSSLKLALGQDLDRLSTNYGAIRKQGSKSSGVALLTFSSITSDVAIPRGSVVKARNGASFITLNDTIVSTLFSNTYRATASEYRSSLDEVGITDEFAVEVTVESTATGLQGNISKYQLNFISVPGVSNVTNPTGFGGGSLPEDDAAFKTRVLGIFSGANTGTALGYENAVQTDPAVLDSIVVGPGDTLMIRDGTNVSIDSEGTRTIITSGTGGKVDVYILGVRLQEVIDSYIYFDKSNTNNATNSANDFVLGQITGDENKTVSQRRVENLADGVLPEQPVNTILTVSGSLSGGNFIEKATDEFGRVTGNYELIKDTGVYSGSPWGFDRLHWISNEISNYPEDINKSIFNGQDALTFTDINEITQVQQRITVTNENSKVDKTNRAIIQLSHKPVTNVTRVLNATTGERYTVDSQNPFGVGSTNTTGKIRIRGSSLPALSDTLQVDYTWVFNYDPSFDFDNRKTSDNIRAVEDSVDWGYSNAVRREPGSLLLSGSFLNTVTTHPISSIVNVNAITTNSSTVSLVSNRNAVVVPVVVSNVLSVIRVSDGTDLWNTSKANGTFNAFTIFLPTDGLSTLGDSVVVTYNAVDIYNLDGYQGNFNNNVINIVPSPEASAGMNVEVNYIANVNTLLPATQLSNLPIIQNINSFDSISSTSIGTQPFTNIYSGSDVVQNLREAPSNIGLTVSGNVSPGTFILRGKTIFGVFSGVMPITNAGNTIDLSYLIRSSLGLNSNQSISSNVKVSKLVAVSKVETTTNLVLLSTLFNYDVKGYQLLDNSLSKNDSVKNTSLSRLQVKLPETDDNISNVLEVGDRVSVTFYYTIDEDTETVSFSRSGTLYTDKRFVYLQSLAISSGFSSAGSSVSTLTLTNLNQPIVSSRYKSFYNYAAPKSNERITITYNLNKLIGDSTLNIENTRPVTADVLCKEGISIPVNVILNIVVLPSFINSQNLVKQNVQDVVTSALNTTQFGQIIDQSDLIVVAQSVDGVDRARIIYFNEDGNAGSVLSISAQRNEFIVPNSVTINIEER